MHQQQLNHLQTRHLTQEQVNRDQTLIREHLVHLVTLFRRSNNKTSINSLNCKYNSSNMCNLRSLINSKWCSSKYLLCNLWAQTWECTRCLLQQICFSNHTNKCSPNTLDNSNSCTHLSPKTCSNNPIHLRCSRWRANHQLANNSSTTCSNNRCLNPTCSSQVSTRIPMDQTGSP